MIENFFFEFFFFNLSLLKMHMAVVTGKEKERTDGLFSVVSSGDRQVEQFGSRLKTFG